MDLAKYKELTGLNVPTSKEAAITATIRRTKAMLETMLGYSLKPKNLYTEKGKVQFEGLIPSDDLTNLKDPDDELGTVKLFQYNETDQYFHVDPFKNVYRVKLVLPVTDNEFVTVLELDNVAALKERDGQGRFLERYHDWFTWGWYSRWQIIWPQYASNGLQLAVEADWADCYPDDVMYVWADMVTHYSDPNYKIRSESVDGHSWNKGEITAPEQEENAKAVLGRLAGPYGRIARNPVR